jgi:hypothetical protein
LIRVSFGGVLLSQGCILYNEGTPKTSERDIIHRRNADIDLEISIIGDIQIGEWLNCGLIP